MDADEALQFVEALLRDRNLRSLSDVQRSLFRGAWQGRDYGEIHIEINRVPSLDHLMRNVGPGLWKLLSELLGDILGEPTKVRKDYLQGPVERARDRYFAQTQLNSPKAIEGDALVSRFTDSDTLDDLFRRQLDNPNRVESWEDAPDSSKFRGRTRELKALSQWILAETEDCRLVALFGMAGIGKTALSAKLLVEIRDRFEVVLWRSLGGSPSSAALPLSELLTDLVQSIAGSSEIRVETPQLLQCLRRQRCLIVLDGWETLFQPGDYSGTYRPEFEAYGDLLQRIGDTVHQSCVLLTSRENPIEVSNRNGEGTAVRAFKLRGMPASEVREIVLARSPLTGSDADWHTLATRYDGNPTFLQQAITTIASAFDQDIDRFLGFQSESPIRIDPICCLLSEQFERLSVLEMEIVAIVAQNQEPITLEELRQLATALPIRDRLLDVVLSLVRRSFLEANSAAYSLDPLVVNYAASLN
jgi:NACHT domain